MTNEEILRKFKRALTEEKIEGVDNIVAILEEVLPLEIKKTITVDDIIKHAERIYQKKYGIDEAYTMTPHETSLEKTMSMWLDSINISYKKGIGYFFSCFTCLAKVVW